MSFTRSRYLIIDERVFRDAFGRRARLAYSARRATLFALDEQTAAALEQGGPLSQSQLARLSDLAAVVSAGQDELAEVLGGLSRGSADPGKRGFTIVPTSYCNMACSYCGQEHLKSAVDNAKLEKLAARVERVIAAPGTTSVGISWFGGEPLLAWRLILELSERFITQADVHGKSYSAHMATNGSLLTVARLRALHEQCRVDAIEITLDGPEQVHDQRRLKRNGGRSYRHITKVLADAVREEIPVRLSVRVNVDRENEDSVEELIRDLAQRGISGPMVELHLAPVHSWGNDVSAVELAARRYARREADWLRLAGSLGLRFGVLPTSVKRTTCQATTIQGEILDAQERVYSCSEHPLVPGVSRTGVVAQVGELTGAGPRPLGMYDDFYDEVAGGQRQCAACPLLPICGGACPKLWREGHQPCPSMKYNWADRVDIAARRLGFTPLAQS